MNIAFSQHGGFYLNPQDPLRDGFIQRELTEDEIHTMQSGGPFMLAGGFLIKKGSSVPKRVKAWQAKAILESTPHADSTLFSVVEAYLGPIPKDLYSIAFRSKWKRNEDFLRDDSSLNELATTIGLSSDQLDYLFTQASLLK